MVHKNKNKSLANEFYRIIWDFNVLYFLLALCYITMTVISIIKLNDAEHQNDKDKWYVILTLTVYIVVAIIYILLSYFTYHKN